MNKLTVVYKAGHSRVVNLDKAFFADARMPVFDIKSPKMVMMSPSDKAVSLAMSLDPNPYTIELIKDGKVALLKTFIQNKP